MNNSVTARSVIAAVTLKSAQKGYSIVIVVALLSVYIVDTLMVDAIAVTVLSRPLLSQHSQVHRCHNTVTTTDVTPASGNCHRCDISVDSSVTVALILTAVPPLWDPTCMCRVFSRDMTFN